MLRRLLACLALLSGLAAVGTPAHAALGEALDQQVGTSLAGDEAEKAVRCKCAKSGKTRPSTSSDDEPCREQRSVTIFIPTVQFGADRAYE